LQQKRCAYVSFEKRTFCLQHWHSYLKKSNSKKAHHCHFIKEHREGHLPQADRCTTYLFLIMCSMACP
jgi:hypothetical protein